MAFESAFGTLIYLEPVPICSQVVCLASLWSWKRVPIYFRIWDNRRFWTFSIRSNSTRETFWNGRETFPKRLKQSWFVPVDSASWMQQKRFMISKKTQQPRLICDKASVITSKRRYFCKFSLKRLLKKASNVHLAFYVHCHSRQLIQILFQGNSWKDFSGTVLPSTSSYTAREVYAVAQATSILVRTNYRCLVPLTLDRCRDQCWWRWCRMPHTPREV